MIPGPRSRGAAVSLLLLLGACGGGLSAAPGATERLQPVPWPGARAAPNPLPARFAVPEGKGPFPVAILLHGCGGPNARQPEWEARLRQWGHASLSPDSMSPRGLISVCNRFAQGSLAPADRIADIAAAVAWLRTRPEIDPRRIAVIGESHGGATAALATQKSNAALGLRASVDFYGRCYDAATQGDVPLLALAGEADDWGNPAASCRAFGAALPPGKVFEVHTYPGVYHAFDSPSVTQRAAEGHIMAYNRDAAEDSFVRVRAFLDRYLAP